MPSLGVCLEALPLMGKVAESYLGELIVMIGGCRVVCEAYRVMV